MKKWKAGLLLVMLTCLIPLAAALAWTGKVTASSLNMRKSNSADSKVVKVLKKGTEVEVISTSGSWYKVKAGGNTGYVAKKYITKSSSSSSSSSSSKSSSSSSKSSSSSSGSAGDPCSPGDKGAAVKAVQKKLKSLGYYTGSIDGDYGNGTKSAVKAFQKRNGLTANGVANSKTISKLNSSSAKKASSSSGSGGGGSSSYTTETLNWFKHPNTIPHHATFQVKDVKTGKVFNVKRWTGANHADCEPASKSDTAIMKSIYGHWSWKRRAILVKYNGHVYAASMNGMPHGTQTIKNNNFDGHFCIHFSGSKTHGSKKVDSEHQSMVKTALKYYW